MEQYEGVTPLIRDKALDGATVELEEDSGENVDLAQQTLVGKLITDKQFNKGAIKSIIAKAWREPKGLKINEIGNNVYMFTFAEKQEVQSVLKRRPWFVMNHLLNLQHWIPEVAAYEIDFTWVPFWIQIHGMPLSTKTTKNAEKLMDNVGEVLEVENPVDVVLAEELYQGAYKYKYAYSPSYFVVVLLDSGGVAMVRIGVFIGRIGEPGLLGKLWVGWDLQISGI